MSAMGIASVSKKGEPVHRKQETLRRLIVSAKRTKLLAQQNLPPRPKSVHVRTMVVRPCVIRMVFLLPLAIIVLERYLDTVFSLDDVREVYYFQMGIDTELQIQRIHVPRNLANLTHTGLIQCPRDQRRMMMVDNPQFNDLHERKIPSIVHQSSKTRCLTRKFDRASLQWALRKSSYYIHDEDAVKRLVFSEFPEFPQLALLSRDCVAESILFGIWKYLVLWTYGGIFADLNSYPSHFNLSTLNADDDGFFLFAGAREALTTTIMAVSPRHPVMYYAVQRSLSNILRMQPKSFYDPQTVVGDDVLNEAVKDFLYLPQTHRAFGKEEKIHVSEGLLNGINARSIRIAGRLSDDGGAIVSPIFITPEGRQRELEKIGMKNWEMPVIGSSCLQEVLAATS